MKSRLQDCITVFLVDDHPLVRQGLAVMLEQGGFAVAGEADSIQATMGHPGLASAQVVLLDISLEQASGADLTPELGRRGLRVVVLCVSAGGKWRWRTPQSRRIRRGWAPGLANHTPRRGSQTRAP